MGADGHILIAKRSKWDQEFPNLDPQEFGFYTGEVLGVEALWGYLGEITTPLVLQECGADARYGPAPDERDKQEKRVASWFWGNAEQHEVLVIRKLNAD